jgi:hypothetical protein
VLGFGNRQIDRRPFSDAMRTPWPPVLHGSSDDVQRPETQAPTVGV